MAFDFKKEYKEFYMPKGTPSIVTIPKMNYIAVRGSGDPNNEDGEYKQSIGLLYGIAFTIKMSKKGDHQIDGYFDYVVPPPDKAEGELILWITSELQRTIWKRSTSAVPFLTIMMLRCHQRRHGWLTGLMRALSF